MKRCEACGMEAPDLIEHQGAFLCPSLDRCDRHANRDWMDADIQAGIDAALNDWKDHL